MSKKPSPLDNFDRKASTQKPAKAKLPRERAKGATVALTGRLPRAEWVRLRQLADAEGVSIQTLIIRGLDREFAAHGLPQIRLDDTTS